MPFFEITASSAVTASGLGDAYVFGLSASAQASAEETSHPYGTLRYMAPERFAGSHDGRSDLYSLGMTLYEMLTLQPAFEADSEAELIRRIQQVHSLAQHFVREGGGVVVVGGGGAVHK